MACSQTMCQVVIRSGSGSGVNISRHRKRCTPVKILHPMGCRVLNKWRSFGEVSSKSCSEPTSRMLTTLSSPFQHGICRR